MRPFFWPVVATTLASFGFAAYKFLVIGEQALAFDLAQWNWLPPTLHQALVNAVEAKTVKEAISQGLAAAITLGVIMGYLINSPLAGAWRASRLSSSAASASASAPC